jgi:hypothetical protein
MAVPPAPKLRRVVTFIRLLATRTVTAGQFPIALDFARFAAVAGIGDAAADITLWLCGLH